MFTPSQIKVIPSEAFDREAGYVPACPCACVGGLEYGFYGWWIPQAAFVIEAEGEKNVFVGRVVAVCLFDLGSISMSVSNAPYWKSTLF